MKYSGVIYRHYIVNDEGVEKSYIGQTVEKPEKRWNHGRNYTKQHNADTKFARAIKKYGWENFSHEIIGVVYSSTRQQLAYDLDDWEMYFIHKYDSYYNGYNSTQGGTQGKVVSDDTKLKITQARTGTTHTEETKQKISQNSKSGQDSVKQKIANSMSYEKNPRALRVMCKNTGQVFDTIKQAAEWCGLRSTSDIIYCCKGKSKTAGKHPETRERLHWIYYSEQ